MSTYYIATLTASFIVAGATTYYIREYIIPILLEAFGNPTNTWSQFALFGLQAFGFIFVFITLVGILWSIKTSQPNNFTG